MGAALLDGGSLPSARLVATRGRPSLTPQPPQESDGLQAEVRLLEEDRRRLLRELALKAELEEGFARRGAAQGAALRQAQVGRRTHVGNGWLGRGGKRRPPLRPGVLQAG